MKLTSKEVMAAMRTKTETEKVVDTDAKPNSETVVAVVDQTKAKNKASVIPGRKRLVKRMMFDSIVKSIASSFSLCFPLLFRSSSGSSESGKEADDHMSLGVATNNDKF